MGGGGNHQKSLLSFHFHHHGSRGSGNGSGSKKYGGGGSTTSTRSMKDVPKGCLAIKVGNREEEQQRFVVPILYFNHPEFLTLLNLAEEEYGFDQKGTITIPCNVDKFLKVQSQIDQETHNYNQHHQQHHHHMKGSSSSSSSFVHGHHHGHHHRPLLAVCFRA